MVLVFGRAGSGKDYLTQHFGLEKVKSYTTRPMRPEELTRKPEELSHIFVDSLDKIKVKTKDFWVARKEHYNAEYGALFSQVEAAAVYVIDPLGVEMFFNNLINNKKKDFADQIRIVNIRSPFWRRFYRMVTRDLRSIENKKIKDYFDAFKRAYERIKLDRELFKSEKEIAKEFNATVIFS